MMNKIYNILVDAGFELPSPEEDFNLTEFIEDSLEFMGAMVAIEDEMKIEIPDEVFDFEALTSFYRFCNLLEQNTQMIN